MLSSTLIQGNKGRLKRRVQVSCHTPALKRALRRRRSSERAGLTVPCAIATAPGAVGAAVGTYVPCLIALTAMAWLGERLGSQTRAGRLISPPVCAMLVGFSVAKLASMTVAHTDCGALLLWTAEGDGLLATTLKSVQTLLVQLATPMLLFSADLGRIIHGESSSLLAVFMVAAIGTMAGTVIGFLVFRHSMQVQLGEAAWKLSTALCAKNIGGGMNYVATANAVSLDTGAFAMGLAADNVAGLIYFPVCGYIGSFAQDQDRHRQHDDSTSAVAADKSNGDNANATVFVESTAPASIRMVCASVVMAVSIAWTITFVSKLLVPKSLILLAATALTISIASVRRIAQTMSRTGIIDAGQMAGTCLLYVFFASAGVTAAISNARLSPSVLGFALLLYVIHFAFVLGYVRLSRGSTTLAQALVASNASIGNPATAMSFAESKGWSSLVLPGIIVGQLGNCLATFISTLLGYGILRWLL